MSEWLPGWINGQMDVLWVNGWSNSRDQVEEMLGC